MPATILMGMKHSGKTSLCSRLAWARRTPSVDLDDLIEEIYRPDRAVDCREIYRQHGREFFRELEAQAADKLAHLASRDSFCASLGGGTIENEAAMESLTGAGTLVYLKDDLERLFERIMRGGIPAFLSPENPHDDFVALYQRRTPRYEAAADIVVPVSGMTLDESYRAIVAALEEYEHAR